MDENEKAEFLAKLIVEAVEQLDSKELTVSTDKESYTTLEKAISKALKKLGKDIKLTLGDPIETRCGVIVRSIDGRSFYDNTIEARIESAKSELLGKVYDILFGGGE